MNLQEREEKKQLVKDVITKAIKEDDLELSEEELESVAGGFTDIHLNFKKGCGASATVSED